MQVIDHAGGTSGVYTLYADHLGSTSITADETGTPNSTLMYKAWGETRLNTGDAPTDYRYTGQRKDSYINLYWMNSRWYDPELGRWTSPDSIIPDQSNPQSWDRYSYVFGNPIKFNDPSGHCPWCLVGALVGAAAGYGIQVYNNYQNGYTGSDAWTQNISAEPIIGGALIGAGAVIFAPAAVAAVGDVLVGAGVTTGSTALFGAGMSAYGASTALGNAITGTPAVATAPGLAPSKTPAGAPDFIGTENGDLIAVPSGAAGPTPTRGAGFQYTGGSGGNGLDSRVTNVRIMDPTLPNPPSPGYPNGYVSYSNAGGQTVNPYTGRTVSPSDPWWHIELK